MFQDNHELHIEKDKENDTFKINHPDALSRSQKLVATGLAFFAFLTVIIWSVQMKSSISSPFNAKLKQAAELQKAGGAEVKTTTGESSCAQGNCGQGEDLTSKDTDGDGLWDWDELNVYHTSPYLEDTDSDGISDKIEIEKENDPVCPVGQTCTGEFVNPGASSETDNEISGQGDYSQEDLLKIIDQLSNQGVPAGTGDKASETASGNAMVENLLGGKSSVAELRAFLKDAGMDAATLDSISDEDLMATYNKMLENK